MELSLAWTGDNANNVYQVVPSSLSSFDFDCYKQIPDNSLCLIVNALLKLLYSLFSLMY